MKKRIEELAEFVEKYGVDFLEDGTKNEIVEALKQGDNSLALEILNSIDREWIERAQTIGKCLVFTDTQRFDSNGEKLRRTFYKANYIDSLELKESHIPTLRKVIPREREMIIPFQDDDWERE